MGRTLSKMNRERHKKEKFMWDVLVTLILMGFGAFMVIAVGAIFIATIFWMQNGGRDE